MFSIAAFAFSLVCNPLDTEIPGIAEGKTFTLRQLVRDACSHTYGAISVPGYDEKAIKQTEIEIINNLYKQLIDFASSEHYKKTIEILRGLPVDYFSIENQQKGWDREHREYTSDTAGNTARVQDIIADILEDMPDPENGALVAFFAEKDRLFELLKLAERHFAPATSPTSSCSSVSASPTTPRRSPPAEPSVKMDRFAYLASTMPLPGSNICAPKIQAPIKKTTVKRSPLSAKVTYFF